MATKFRYSKWALAAIIGGVVLTAIEVVGTVSYLVQQDSPSYLVAGGAVVTIVAAMFFPLAERCWRGGRRILASLLALSLVPVLSLIFSAAVERTGGARDEANRSRQAVAQQIELRRTAVKRGQGRCRCRRVGSQGRVRDRTRAEMLWSGNAGRHEPATARNGPDSVGASRRRPK